VHRESWPTVTEVLAPLGGSPDPGALTKLDHASDVSAAIRRERSLAKRPFGVPVQSLQVDEAVRDAWNAIAADVLAGNNAASAVITFGAGFRVEFAPAP
jgi:hypothetical protein